MMNLYIEFCADVTGKHYKHVCPTGKEAIQKMPPTSKETIQDYTHAATEP